MLHCFRLSKLNDHLFGKEMFIQFTMPVFCEHLSVSVRVSFPFGFGDWMWNLTVFIVLDHCLSFYIPVSGLSLKLLFEEQEKNLKTSQGRELKI